MVRLGGKSAEISKQNPQQNIAPTGPGVKAIAKDGKLNDSAFSTSLLENLRKAQYNRHKFVLQQEWEWKLTETGIGTLSNRIFY